MKNAIDWHRLVMQLFADYPWLWLVAASLAVLLLLAVAKLIVKIWPKKWDPGWDIQNRNTPTGSPPAQGQKY